MADALQNYIDDTWGDAQDGARFDVFNPATGEVIATAPVSKQADADAAVSAARRTFEEGSWWPGELGKEGVEDFLEKKSVYLNLS
jgi:(Z)-2-((N-methylformamido)methylene)-5-hydroxybutyrolactone dehydrogenase